MGKKKKKEEPGFEMWSGWSGTTLVLLDVSFGGVVFPRGRRKQSCHFVESDNVKMSNILLIKTV